MTPTAGDSSWDDLKESELPRVLTSIPGPRSVELWNREMRHHAQNASAGALYTRLVLQDALGPLVRDVDGNVFIDFASGTVVSNLGHCPPSVVAALQREIGRLIHFYDFATEPRSEFMSALAATLPPSLDTFQMYTTGGEAVEAAIRAAKSYTKGYEVISFYNAFHGRTAGAAALSAGSGQRPGFGPFVPGTLHSPNAYCYRCPLGLTRDSCEVACARFIEKVYEQSSDRRVAAVIIEPVQGAGGVIPHPPEFLMVLREFCDRVGALLIFDEILTGAGRTGTMWAFEQSGVIPDILVAGKGLASGFPISLIASRPEVMAALPFGQPGGGATTFASSNLACAAGLATLELLKDGRTIQHARDLGNLLLEQLRLLQSEHPIIGDVRGSGMLIGVELVANRDTKQPVGPDVSRMLLQALAARGVLTVSGGPVLRITPPLVISEGLASRGVQILDGALSEVEAALALA